MKAKVLFFVIVAATCLCSTSGLAESTDWKPVEGPLTTVWTEKVSPDNALPEYPRPQMVRSDWLNLNGLWDFSLLGKDDPKPTEYTQKILVPYPVESSLSGIAKKVEPGNRIWYRRTFTVPAAWAGKRVLLHFGGVDWDATVSLDGKEIGSHRGGYDSFTLEITEGAKPGSEHEIIVSVLDPTNAGGQPVGKQTLEPGGIFYTASSGIWRTVWLEAVPKTYIKRVNMTPDVDNSCLRLKFEIDGDAKDSKVEAEALDGEETVARAEGRPDEELKLAIPNAKLWTPDSPFLYGLKLRLRNNQAVGPDDVKGYFGMRKVSIGPDEKGIVRILLNDKFIFQIGPLDQGFWPDGLYTAPTDDALRFDVEKTREYGFNMSRKHVKVEPDRWYYWCDKLGVMVWQDMAGAGNGTDELKKQFETEFKGVIDDLRNHPSIIMWVAFNEGWGQYDTPRIVSLIKEWDPTRLVDNASGWTDTGTGDVLDAHSYPVPSAPRPEEKRASVVGEFGGLGFNFPDHTWTSSGWGYDLFQDQKALNKRYEEIFEVLRNRCEDPGISAGVYTQISDIETENNGLMTYDRKICKVDPKVSERACKGYTAPRMVDTVDKFIDSIDVGLKCFRGDAKIRYTLDGAEPTDESKLYEGPIHVTETTTIKAKAYWPDGEPSEVSEYTVTKTTPIKSATQGGTRAGLQVAYFEGKWEKLPEFEKLTVKDAYVAKSFDVGRMSRRGGFAIKFDGWIEVPTTGVYVFRCASDDGSRLLVAGETVVENDGIHGMKVVEGSVALDAGFHPICLLYFQGSGGMGLRVSYKVPGGEQTRIPPEALSCTKTIPMTCAKPEIGDTITAFVGETDVRLRCDYEDAKIYYTIDGSVPSDASTLYGGPIHIAAHTLIRAVAYAEDMQPSALAEFGFVKETPIASVKVENPERGLEASYYEAIGERLPDSDDLKPVKTYIAKTVNVDDVDKLEEFALRFDGYVNVPKTGIYRFFLWADDEAKLFVAGKEVIEQAHYTQREQRGYLALEEGFHPIRLLYVQGNGGKGIDLKLEGPGLDKQSIPENMLQHNRPAE